VEDRSGDQQAPRSEPRVRPLVAKCKCFGVLVISEHIFVGRHAREKDMLKITSHNRLQPSYQERVVIRNYGNENVKEIGADGGVGVAMKNRLYSGGWLVPRAGVEPARPYGQRILSPFEGILPDLMK
jgi:hypothetical protein